ncbi:MAG TPA: dihydrofolate reductase family protein [Jatrophihabitantaceae bacterium]|jgi:dihydrofolate reductase|nr:dihydrofolate reductase family protein [Jatrophihabitantaceae bacterium]
MGKIFTVEYVTLDGVFEEPGWSGPYFNKELEKFQQDNLSECDGLLLGRVTYEGFAQAWPAMEAETGDFGVRMNSIPKWVASTTVTEPTWNASVLDGDVPSAVAALKERDLTLMVAGSATLVETLRANGLIDEYRLMIYPVVVGSGRRLFGDGAAPGELKLTDATTTESGVIIARYVPA